MVVELRRSQPDRNPAEVEISLTDFVDFTVTAGPPKVTKVREIKNRPEWKPETDFWRPMRDAIVELHRSGQISKQALLDVVERQTHAQKQRLYPRAAAGYVRFLGRRPVSWFAPARGLWRAGRLSVRVNPEIGLDVGGVPTVIKLYFKKEELTSSRVQASIGVMVAELTPRCDPGTQFGVLDVKAGKLLLPDGRWNPMDAQALIRGEARSFIEIWDSV